MKYSCNENNLIRLYNSKLIHLKTLFSTGSSLIPNHCTDKEKNEEQNPQNHNHCWKGEENKIKFTFKQACFNPNLFLNSYNTDVFVCVVIWLYLWCQNFHFWVQVRLWVSQWGHEVIKGVFYTLRWRLECMTAPQFHLLCTWDRN